jgi:hypothetical protein
MGVCLTGATERRDNKSLTEGPPRVLELTRRSHDGKNLKLVDATKRENSLITLR